MLFKTFRAAAAAFLMGTAVVAVGAVAVTAPAAAAVSSKVGKPLQRAQALAASGNYKAALAAVSEAENAATTGEERNVVSQMRNYIAAKSGIGGGGVGIRAKFANDYNAGRYRDVINDADQLRHEGGLDANSMQVVAQAYYMLHDYAGCVRYIKNNLSGGGEGVLTLQMRCAFEGGDNESMRQSLEQLVSRTNKPEYWGRLLDTAQGTKGITDHGTLDVYRLKLLTGTLAKKDDYSLLAQLALQFGFAAESASVVQKGMDAKVLTDDRSTRLLNLAKGQAAANAANFAKTQATANGDTLVKLGEDAWGQGKFPDALKLVQAGIAKGVTDNDNAQIRLGMALLGAGQKDAAIKTFNKVTDPKQKVVANLWSIYAKTH